MALPSFYPVQQAFVEECGSMFGLGKDYILCNGPFLVEDYELGNTYWSYTRNPDFVGYPDRGKQSGNSGISVDSGFPAGNAGIYKRGCGCGKHQR